MRDEGRSKKRPSPGRAEAVEADINAVPKGQERHVKHAHGRLEDEADLRCCHLARLELSIGKPKKPIALYGVIPYIRLEAETM
jgi:hypothetical protein